MLEGIITKESDAVYHGRSQSGELLSSHLLQRFAKMPYKYYATITGIYQEPDKPEYAFGRAAHKIILEGQEAFNNEYTVSDGPVNERTGKPYGKDTKIYQDWLSCQIGQIVSNADYDEIHSMFKNIQAHIEISKLLSGSGIAEGVVRAEVEGVQCQIKMDYFDPAVGIIDLKTCRDIQFFESDMRAFGYCYQMAFYRSVLRAATGKDWPVYIIAVDKTEFHTVGYWLLPGAELDVAERVNAASIKRLKECRETGIWPTGYERKQIFCLNK